jgi:integrin beta 1
MASTLYPDTAACISPYDGEVCSGHGECTCGMCMCSQEGESGGLYTGDYCERAPGRADPCQEVADCIECQHFNTGTDRQTVIMQFDIL